jgi:hypothetical protein
MRWMLLKSLSKFHYQKAAQEIIQETGDPAAATAEAIFERGNKTLAENKAMYENRPRKIPRVEGKLATGRAFAMTQVKRPRNIGKPAIVSRMTARRFRRLSRAH